MTSSVMMIGLTVDCFLFIDPAFELMELKSISSWPGRGMIHLEAAHCNSSTATAQQSLGNL